MGLFSSIGKAVGGFVGGVIDGLLSFSRGPVDSILSQLTKQVDVVREEAFSPIQLIADQVAGGEVWRGAGADAFVEDISNIALPGLGQIGENIEAMHKCLQTAADTIDQVDEEVEQLVINGLQTAFKAIF